MILRLQLDHSNVQTQASGARPIPQLLPSEVLHIKGLLAQELGSASQHLSDRLARKVASACLQAALNAVRREHVIDIAWRGPYARDGRAKRHVGVCCGDTRIEIRISRMTL